jgi:DNA polymerase-3 subunit epsilon
MIPRAIKRLFHQASIGDQSYRFMFERERTDEVVAIDCETTGLNVRTDDIITIAAIKIRGNRIMTSERFEATVALTPACRQRRSRYIAFVRSMLRRAL